MRQDNVSVRRLVLAPGEAMHWHRDPCRRVAVVLNGDLLQIEFRNGSESKRVEVQPGQVDWEQPSSVVHRAVNVGKTNYEQVTVFLLDSLESIAQPIEE